MVEAFSPSVSLRNHAVSTKPSTSALSMANGLFNSWDKSRRQASSDEKVVELLRPLGLVLNEDDSGNVYVETVAPKGNAARTGLVSYWEGHCERISVMCQV